jgi:hypothetical protein
MIWALITLLLLVLLMVAKQTIKTSRLESPIVEHPIVDEDAHLFAERPHHTEIKEPSVKVDQKNIVITEMMVNGTIDFARAKELGVNRLSSVIFRLRKHYEIMNVVEDGKFVHYKLIRYKGK